MEIKQYNNYYSFLFQNNKSNLVALIVMISWPNDVPNPIHYHTAEAAHSGVTTGRRRGYKFIYPSGTLPHNHPNPNVTPNSIIPTSTTPEPKSIRQWQHSVYRNQNWAPTIQSFKCIHNLTTARYVFKRKQLWNCASRPYFCIKIFKCVPQKPCTSVTYFCIWF